MSEKDDTRDEESKSDANADGSFDPAKCQSELAKAKSDYLYLLAEFDNYRKNAIKERSDMTKYGSERFIREFLNVFDNFERALESSANADANVVREGVQMIAVEIKNLLQRFGVEEVKADGEDFDPSKHEALSSEPRGDIDPGKVVRVFKKAYKLHDKLLRPAQVVVSVQGANNN